MRVMGLEAIYQKPNTSRPHPDHKVYPYLLRGLIIDPKSGSSLLRSFTTPMFFQPMAVAPPA
jgi:hypothetical protein